MIEKRLRKFLLTDSSMIKKFMRFLPTSVRLLTETFLFANKIYAEIGLTYNWEEIFLLPANAVYCQERGPCQIMLYRYAKYGTDGEQWYGHFLPQGLATKLKKISTLHQDNFLFLQENGHPFDVDRLDYDFRKASQQAIVSGFITRPIIPRELKVTPLQDLKSIPGTFSKDLLANHPDALPPVTLDMVEKIEKLFLPKHNAGRQRKIPLIDILQALLAQTLFNLSRLDLHQYFPKAARAAEKQRERWCQDGIWDQIQPILST